MRTVAWGVVSWVFATIGSAYAVDVAGVIDQDTTWAAAQSPYVVTADLTVNVGATLTIEPGVEVRVRGADTTITVRGGLVANGEAANRVVFRPDGPDAPGGYEGIRVNPNARLTLRSTRLLWADNPLHFTDPATIRIEFADAVARDYANTGVTVAGGLDFIAGRGLTLDGGGVGLRGVYLDGVPGHLEDMVVINHVNTGIHSRDAGLRLTRVVVAHNAGDGVYAERRVMGESWISANFCTFWGNGDALEGNETFFRVDIQFVLRDSIFEANTGAIVRSTQDATEVLFLENVWTAAEAFVDVREQPFFLDQSIYAGALLADPEGNNFEPTDRSPARSWDPADPAATKGAVPHAGAPTGDGLHGYWYTDQVFPARSVNTLTGDMVITAGASIVFEPGAQLRMTAGADAMKGGLDPERIEIRVDGTLRADGTNSRPVQLVSDAAVPAPADWYGLIITPQAAAVNTAQLHISHVQRGLSLLETDVFMAGVTVRHSAAECVYVEGGAPGLDSARVEHCAVGVRATADASLALNRVVVRESAGYGVHLTDANATIEGSLVHHNAADGIFFETIEDTDRTLTLDQCTIAHNDVAGVRTHAADGEITLNMWSSSITHNTEEGVVRLNRRTTTCSDTNIWGNSAPLRGLDLGFWDGYSPRESRCFSSNPLFADAENGDYEPTHRSPLRANGADGSDVGAVAHVDAETADLHGWFHEDFTFTAAQSPYAIVGDIVVPAGVSVVFEPGAVLDIAASDQLGAAPGAETIELRFLSDSSVTVGSEDGPEVHFRSAAEVPEPGDWGGLIFNDPAAASVTRARLDYPDIGIRSFGPRATPMRYPRVQYSYTAGILISGVFGEAQADVFGAQVLGGDSLGTGIELRNSDGRVRSSAISKVRLGVHVTRHPRPDDAIVHLVNNTIVDTFRCLSVRRERNSGDFFVYAYNNITADCFYWIYDDSPSWSARLFARHNLRWDIISGLRPRLEEDVENLEGEPLFEDLDQRRLPQWWDLRVWRQSPAIDAGDGMVDHLPAFDAAGRPRVQGEGVDIGAFEFDPQGNESPRADPVEEVQRAVAVVGEPFEISGDAAFDPDGQIVEAFWTLEDGTVLHGLTVMHTLHEAVSVRADLTVVDDDGARDHATIYVAAGFRPVAEAGPPVFQDEGPDESVFFDGSASTDDRVIVAWEWDFGDGSPVSNEESPRHSYLSAGLYTARLTVTDNQGLTDSDTTLATVFGDEDIVGPLIEHEGIADGQPLDSDVTVRAIIRDPADVTSAVLFYRVQGGASQFVVMQPEGGDAYAAVIPAVQSPAMEYWITAIDGVEPDPNRSAMPPGAPEGGVFDFAVHGDLDPPVIAHMPIANNQPAGEAVVVQATLTDAAGIAEATLYFRAQGALAFAAAPMRRLNGDGFAARIPGLVVGGDGVEYYLEVRDGSPVPNTAFSPAGAPGMLHRFTVQGADQAPPVIGHAPIANDQPVGEPINIAANVIDAEGQVASVVVHYRGAGNGPYSQAPLARIAGDDWQGAIPGAAVDEPGMQYYIEARDDADNAAFAPPGAPAVPHGFTVVAADRDGPEIVHAPVPDGRPLDEPVLVTAIVNDPAGVDAVRLYYRPVGFPFFQESAMIDMGGSWTGTIPGFSVQSPAVEYYVRAVDAEGNFGFSPAAAPDVVHTFTVSEDAVDAVGPIIEHAPPEGDQPAGVQLRLTATVADDSGVASVTAFTRTQGEVDFVERPMQAGPDDGWHVDVPAARVEAPGVEYYLRAVDAADAANASRAPEAEDVFGVGVVAPDLAGPTIEHAPPGPAFAGDQLFIEAQLSDPSGVADARVFWRTAGEVDFAQVALAMVDDIGRAEIGPLNAPGVEYYLSATDTLGNASRSPAGETFEVAVELAPVNAAPIIAHMPIAAEQPLGVAVAITAIITDDSAVDGAELFFRQQGEGDFLSVPMATNGDDMFTGTIPGFAVQPPGVEYYLLARDDAAEPRLRRSPAEGAHRFVVEAAPLDAVPPAIEHDRIEVAEQGAPIAITAIATDASGVDSVQVWFRFEGEDWLSSNLVPDGADAWSGRIPAFATGGDAVEYYLAAEDTVGNEATLPDADGFWTIMLEGGAVDMGAVDMGAVDMGAVDMGAVDMGAVDMGAVDMGAVDMGAVDMGAVDMGAVDMGAVDMGAVDMGAVDMGAVDMNAVDMGAVDMNAVDMGAVDVGAVDMRAVDVGGMGGAGGEGGVFGDVGVSSPDPSPPAGDGGCSNTGRGTCPPALFIAGLLLVLRRRR